MINIVKLLAVYMFSFLVTGCVDWVNDTSDLKEYVAKTRQVEGGKIKPLPEFKPYNSFVYEGASMREPFRAIVPVEEERLSAENGDESGMQPDKDREKDYLETFPVDKLRMVGTINERDEERLWALIEDENSEIHRVTIGDYMGLDHGEIVSLDERQINLVEIIKNGRGGWMKRTRSLALNEPE